jgi:O-antigen/teichoic acid export membrane protein
VSNESGTWILGVTSPIAVVGAWGRAWSTTKQLVTVNTRITEMLFPTLVERRARGDLVGFTRVLVDTLRYVTAGMFLPAAAAGGASVGVMELFGSGFSQASDALAVLLVIPAATTLSLIQRHALYALDRPGSSAISGLYRMAATLAASIPLAIALGSVGPAIGLIVGLSVDLAYMGRIVGPQLSQPVRKLWSKRQMLALALAYGVGFTVARITDTALDGPLGVLAALVAGSVAYIAVFVLAGGIGDRDRQRIREVRAMLVRRRARGAGSEAPASAG